MAILVIRNRFLGDLTWFCGFERFETVLGGFGNVCGGFLKIWTNLKISVAFEWFSDLEGLEGSGDLERIWKDLEGFLGIWTGFCASGRGSRGLW